MENDLTAWQRIFLMSVVNGADNGQDLLQSNGWQFPKSTWLQERLKQIREKGQPSDANS